VEPQRFAARIDPGWWIARGPNGGYVAAILLRALAISVDDPERAPRSLTTYFLAPPSEGPVEIVTHSERRGRSMTAVSARMTQGDRPIAMALAAFSKARPGFEHVSIHRPQVPPPDRCPTSERRMPIHDRYELRWAFGEPPFSGAAAAESGGWIRLRDPRPADALLVAAYADSFPPSVFATLHDGPPIVGLPTVDLTVHFRAPLPIPDSVADEFTLAVFRSRYARQGFVEEDGEIWSRDGVLLAQSRQLAVLL
jgi:acyl-CoA thioesterase